MDKKIISGIAAAIAVIIAIAAIAPNIGVDTTESNVTETNYVSLSSIDREKIGLVINSATPSKTISDIQQVYVRGAESGVGRTNVYVLWTSFEPEPGKYNWDYLDVVMSFLQKNNMKATLFFSVVNGDKFGPFPDWMGKPGIGKTLEVKTIKTLDVILSRYNKTQTLIDTIIIGGEIDGHFRNNPAIITNYKDFFDNISGNVQAKFPNVKFGNTISLNNVIDRAEDEFVSQLIMGDFVGFSYKPTDLLNEINRTQEEAKADLDKMFELVPNKKIGMFEISWSTSDFIMGNENDQKKFIITSLEFLKENQERFEFFTWYRIYDKVEGTCTSDLIEEISGGGFTSNSFTIERLDKYSCNSGLIDINNNPKSGWIEFQKQIQE